MKKILLKFTESIEAREHSMFKHTDKYNKEISQSETPRDGIANESKIVKRELCITIRGGTRPGESDTKRTCQNFINAYNREHQLNYDLNQFDRCIDKVGNLIENVDCIAVDGDEELYIQVTRAFSDSQKMKELAYNKYLSLQLSIDDACKLLMTSIDNKASSIPLHRKGNLILLLDANRTHGLSFADVIEKLIAEHHTQLFDTRFMEIWITGYNEDCTRKII